MVRAVRQNPPTRYGIWLIPTLNPDAYASYSRFNANYVDLNEDGLAVSQPETRALMSFTELVHPVLSVHVHSPNGVVAWFGTSGFVQGNPDKSNAPLSSAIARYVHDRTDLGIEGAGVRFAPSRWFLWQGQRLVVPGAETLLLELHAVAAQEVLIARPRPATHTVDQVDQECLVVLAGLDALIP